MLSWNMVTRTPPGYIASKTGVYKDFPINRPQNLIGWFFPSSRSLPYNPINLHTQKCFFHCGWPLWRCLLLPSLSLMPLDLLYLLSSGLSLSLHLLICYTFLLSFISLGLSNFVMVTQNFAIVATETSPLSALMIHSLTVQILLHVREFFKFCCGKRFLTNRLYLMIQFQGLKRWMLILS